MKTITVNVDEKVASRFRQRAVALFGRKKGALGKAVTEALEQWSQREDHYSAFRRLLEEGRNLGGLTYTSRDELHDRH